MNRIQESKQTLQSEELWFSKTNYMAKFLNEKSNQIIEKINKKNMKNLILTLMMPLCMFSQTYYDNALQFQNTIRNYYDITPLSYDNDLQLHAQEWADYIASTDSFRVSSDNYGESIFKIEKAYRNAQNKDVLLEASINWLLNEYDYNPFNQMVYPGTTRIGFGISENDESVYVVAKYDKLYE